VRLLRFYFPSPSGCRFEEQSKTVPCDRLRRAPVTPHTDLAGIEPKLGNGLIIGHEERQGCEALWRCE
jgi:hypothetical protein